MNSKPDSVAKKMLTIFANMGNASLPFTILICSTKKRHQQHRSKGKFTLLQKERDLLKYLKDDPSMKQIVLQKILGKNTNSDDDTVSSASSSSPPKPEDFQDFQHPYEL